MYSLEMHSRDPGCFFGFSSSSSSSASSLPGHLRPRYFRPQICEVCLSANKSVQSLFERCILLGDEGCGHAFPEGYFLLEEHRMIGSFFQVLRVCQWHLHLPLGVSLCRVCQWRVLLDLFQRWRCCGSHNSWVRTGLLNPACQSALACCPLEPRFPDLAAGFAYVLPVAEAYLLHDSLIVPLVRLLAAAGNLFDRRFVLAPDT